MSRHHSFASIILLISCDTPQKDSGIQAPSDSIPPVAEITSHADQAEFLEAYPITFTGVVSDPTHSADTLLVRWLVDTEVLCDTQAPLEDGTSTCDTILSVDDSRIALEVTNPEAQSATSSIDITVLPTEAPAVNFISPDNDSWYYSNQAILFEATVTDTEDSPQDLTVAWESDIDGPLPDLGDSPESDGYTGGAIELSEGNHVITLTAEDLTGKSTSESLNLSIGPANTPPTCSIAIPFMSVFEEDSTLVLEGLATDLEMDNTLLTAEWYSDKDGFLGSSTVSEDGHFTFSTDSLSLNTHMIELRVSDEIGFSCSDSLELHIGNAPLITLNTPQPNAIYAEGETIDFSVLVSDAQDAPEFLMLDWMVNGASIGTQSALNTGIAQLSTASLSAGLYDLVVTVTDSSGLSSTAEGQFTVNAPPTAPLIELSPSSPTTSDTLTASIITPSIDPEGSPVTLTTEWYKDGLLQTNATSQSIDPIHTSKGELWTLRMTPSDGLMQGPYGEASVTIQNSPPSVSSLTLSPNGPVYNDTSLSCSATISDPDGESPTVTTLWTLGNTLLGSGSSLDLSTTAVMPEDSLSCTITATDPDGEIAEATETLTIENRTPLISSLDITPNTDVTTSSTLECIATATDSDGETPSISYEWIIGSNSYLDNPLTLTPTMISPEATLYCAVTASDAYGGLSTESASVIVINTPPSLSLQITAAGIGNNALLTCEATASDADDSNPPTLSYEWLDPQGNSMGSSTSLQLSPSLGVHGDVFTCQVAATDNQGATVTESALHTISNSPPSITDIELAPETPTAGTSEYFCQASTEDSDGETVSLSYSWTLNGQPLNESSDALNGSFSYLDILSCEAVPNDGFENGEPASASVSITNSSPVVEGLTLSPSTVQTNDSITATVSLSDLDGLQALSASYDWHVVDALTGLDSLVQSGSLSSLDGSQFFDRDDLVYVVVTPNDGLLDGSPVTSQSLSIANSPPEAPSLLLSPSIAYAGRDDLVCSIDALATDPDNDNLSYQFDWTDDNGLLLQSDGPASSISSTLSGGLTEAGTYTCTVTASDDALQGPSVSQSQSVIYDCFCPKVDVQDYSYTYWPTNFRPWWTWPAFSSIRHVVTGHYGMAFEVTTGSIVNLGNLTDELDVDTAVLSPASRVSDMAAASVGYGVQIGSQTHTASSFKGRDQSTSNPSQLIDGGRFMQHIDIPIVEYSSNGDLTGRIELAAMPQHFVLSHHLESSQDYSTPVTLQMTFDGAAFTQYPNETWLDGQRALQLDNGSDEGWVIILPSDGIITHHTDGHLSFERPLQHLLANTPERLSALILPLSGLSEAQLNAYLYPGQSTSVSYAQMDRAGSLAESLTAATWDETRGVYLVELDTLANVGAPNHPNWNNADHHNWYSRHRVILNSTAAEPVSIPIALDGASIAFYITAGAPMFRDDAEQPTGLPVQVSKNWHDTSNTPAHWYHFYTQATLPEAGSHELELTVAHSKWGEAYAASHAQLSLVGWGMNQQWDESALGAWGESVTYDPDLTLQRAMIDDVRPFLVQSNSQWGWTGNVGGANFLAFTEANGWLRHRLGNLKTHYAETGPNMTDVVYAGITDDGSIEAELRTQLGRTDDLVRVYYQLSYTFLEDVSYSRLSFFQVAADNYADNGFQYYAYGNENGTSANVSMPNHGTTGYASNSDRGIPLDGLAPWVMLYSNAYTTHSLPEQYADVGYVIRDFEANIGGNIITTPHISLYRTNNGGWSQMAFELGLPDDPSNRFVPAGSTVRATIEYLVPPADKSRYYGSSDYLVATASSSYSTPSMMHMLAVDNMISVTPSIGQLSSTYPIELEAAEGDIAAQWTQTGGLGYTPVRILELNRYDGWTLEKWDGANWVEVDQSVEGNDFWQAKHNAARDTWTLTFNVHNRGTNDYRLIR